MPRVKRDEKYAKNPFINSVVAHTVTGTKMVYANPASKSVADTFAAVDKETGEVRNVQDITFGKRITVDKTRFLKFYADGVRMFLGLSSAGIKVFMAIYQQLIDDDKFQQEKIILSYDSLPEEIQDVISKATFYRGIRELKKVNLIAPTLVDAVYWINIDYIFKGNRLTLVNQYVLDEHEELERKKDRKIGK